MDNRTIGAKTPARSVAGKASPLTRIYIYSRARFSVAASQTN